MPLDSKHVLRIALRTAGHGFTVVTFVPRLVQRMGQDLTSGALLMREDLEADASYGADQEGIRVHDLFIAKEGADPGPFEA